MKDNDKNPFTGLPALLINEILAKNGQIAREIFEPFHEICANRGSMRDRLQKDGIIQNDSVSDGQKILTSCGVEGFSSVEKILANDLDFSAAFAVEGLAPPSQEKHWNDPAYSLLNLTEKQFPEKDRLLQAVMMEMMIELAASAPHNIIFLNESFTHPFVSILLTLPVAMEAKESLTAQTFLKRMKTAIQSLKTIFDSEKKDKIWVGIPRNLPRKELIKLRIADFE